MLSKGSAFIATLLLSGSAFACDPECPPVAIEVIESCDELKQCDAPGLTAIRPLKNGNFVFVGEGGDVPAGAHIVIADQNGSPVFERVATLDGSGRNVKTFTKQQNIMIQTDSDGNFVVTMNGKKLPQDKVIRTDNGMVKIIGENGEAVFEVKTGDGFGNGFTFDLADGQNGLFSKVAPSKRGQIGITMIDVDPVLAEHLGLDPEQVVMVGQVLDGQPASKAGVQTHDIITHVDGKDGITPQSIRATVQGKKEGHEVRLRVLRRGIPHDITIPVQIVSTPTAPAGMGGVSGMWGADDPFDGDAQKLFGRLLKEDGDGRMGWVVDPEQNAEWLERLAKRNWNESMERAPQPRAAKEQSEAIERLEERLERLEKMLHELLEQKKKSDRAY